jgi:GT2 family glycosyltransferase
MVTVSIVVLSHNRLEDLKNNLQQFLAELPAEVELIVVDNASTDGSVEFLKQLQQRSPMLKLVLQDINSGVAIGRNCGFRLAQGAFIVSLDDDAVLPVADIARVPELFASQPTAGILAFCVRHAKTGEKQNDHGECTVPVANFHGAAHAIRSELFDRVGYLDELCSFGGEEFEFSVRCHAAGYCTVYLPQVQARHNSYPRPGQVGAERRVTWVYNYVRILHKFFPWRMATLFSLRYLWLSIKWSRGGGLLFYARMFRTAWRARGDGRRSHAPVGAETVRFYADPTLFPQYGNAPLNLLGLLTRKIARVAKRRFGMATGA